GNGLNAAAFDIPVFEVASLDSSTYPEQTLKAALDYNIKAGYASNLLYAMQFDANMWSGSSDSATCMRRSYGGSMNYCQPVGEKSVWASVSPSIQPADKKPVIVVASHFDGGGFVHDLIAGHAARASMVVLLGIAETLARAPNIANLPANIVFTLFGAETWSYSGSQRFVKDLTESFACVEQASGKTAYCPFSSGACANPCRQDLDYQKINFDSISSIVEIDVGGLLYTTPATGVNMYLHVDRDDAATSALATSFQNTSAVPGFNGSAALQLSFSAASSASANNRLPPSSAMAFLAKKYIPTVVVSDYQSKFSNPYYGSEFDDMKDWTDAHVTAFCGIVNSTARSLYQLASGSTTPASVVANCSVVQQYLDCVTRNFSCPLMQSFAPNATLKTTDGSYSSVFSFGQSLHYVSYFAYQVLQSVLASKTSQSCAKDSDCASVVSRCMITR
ncbi:hypothetical protein HDU91_001641, partial [Kappamyces sp. JEL0680]